jgi:hypothetical protein
METIIVVSGFIFVVVLSRPANKPRKARKKLKVHTRCEVCESRLKAANGRYAIRCRRCGEVQAWSLKPLGGTAHQERSEFVIGKPPKKPS